ncbi:FAD:protein FMN transferase [Pseudoflavitalea sp. G-6-1-2]|uniref:FAD:protein FMN transferase n=1 Tax=Pseudoflavitalea sp. G-6-1-2 TaxID=2728841 RepID=UPI00146B6EB8|nr:FAD:protein FMN transferase [Pseudoflavitalea sp. G-6-1-2]NML22645.1 FAD:protein FMN transferase [Pseudoflavitalea sp. G-6-1-2]
MRCLTVICLLLVVAAVRPAPKKAWRLQGFAQGTTWHITYYSTDSILSFQSIDSTLQQLDSSLSIYKPYSRISRFNDASDCIESDIHLSNVVEAALQTYAATNGIFDITIYPVVQAWGFGTKKVTELPDSFMIQQLRACVNSRYLSFRGSRLCKQQPCVKIDVNGIAQGYSVDVLADLLEQRGITDYIIELGGEIRLRGRKYPGGEKMQIGIEAPGDNEFQPAMLQQVIAPGDGAITTSGSYRKFYESDGKKITHIIDARTGYPVQNQLISVTVLAKKAITADAYDNALMAMGLKQAFAFLQHHPELEAYFIYRKQDGSIADTGTAGFEKWKIVE